MRRRRGKGARLLLFPLALLHAALSVGAGAGVAGACVADGAGAAAADLGGDIVEHGAELAGIRADALLGGRR